jgi:hypothetical protein
MNIVEYPGTMRRSRLRSVEKGRGRSDGAAVEIEGGVYTHATIVCGNVNPFCNPLFLDKFVTGQSEMVGERRFDPPSP